MQDVILQSLFDGARPSASPTFVLLAGAAGAGTGRAIAQLRREHAGDLIPITIEDLQAFHPRFLERQFRQSPAGQQELAQLGASWLQASISHARENRYSLLLEGSFRSADTALGVAHRFADSGYHVHVVTVAARVEESLLTATSRDLRRMQHGRPAQFITPADNERSITDVNALVAAAADDQLVDRVSVLSRHGQSLFDARRSPSSTMEGASATLRTAESEKLSALEAAQWLSELRHMTRYAQSLRALPSAAVESLVELHEVAIQRIVPELPVPPGSEVVRIQQEKLAADLATLKRTQVRPEVVDVAAPIVVPAEPGPSISR